MARRFRFHSDMLNGHPGNIARAVRRVIVRGVNHGLIVTSTTDGGHAKGSWHFILPPRNFRGRAVDFGHRHPGTPEARAAEVALQRDLIETHGAQSFHELFGPDNTLNVKNGIPVTLIEGTALETLHDTHVHVAPRRVLPLPTLPLRARLRLKARRAGARFTGIIYDQSTRTGLGFALGLALIEQESGYRNVFGHDPTIFIGAGVVTEANYKSYKAQRGTPGRRMQGVGPAQLTWWEYQDRADARGGCWRPEHNIRVGFDVLAASVRANGLRRGLAVYNGGSRNPNLAYADQVLARRAKWLLRLA